MLSVFFFGGMFLLLALIDIGCEVWLAQRRYHLSRLDAVRLFVYVLIFGQWTPERYVRRDADE